jgi:hypothetical protein
MLKCIIYIMHIYIYIYIHMELNISGIEFLIVFFLYGITAIFGLGLFVVEISRSH